MDMVLDLTYQEWAQDYLAQMVLWDLMVLYQEVLIVVLILLVPLQEWLQALDPHQDQDTLQIV